MTDRPILFSGKAERQKAFESRDTEYAAARETLKAALSAPAEGVAWRVRERPGFNWNLMDYDPHRVPSLQGHEIQPLYTHPASNAQPVAEDAREALRELANVKMDLSLNDWCRICNTILSAITRPASNALLEEVERVLEDSEQRFIAIAVQIDHCSFSFAKGICSQGEFAVRDLLTKIREAK